MYRYLFRALNSDDLKNLKSLPKPKPITAQNPNLSGFLDKVVDHIRNGSNSNKPDCWISACKDMDVCIREYAIPQNGNYNTTNERKSIAVIDVSPWITFAQKDTIRNYTVFLDGNQEPIGGLRLSNTDVYPVPQNKKMGKCKRSIVWNNQCIGLGSKVLNEQVETFKAALHDNIEKIEFGILDCSKPNIIQSKQTKCIQELALFQLCQKNKSKSYQAEIIGGFASAIESGSAIHSTEVLFLVQIPKNLIVKILSPFEQDLLSMIENMAFRKQVLEALIKNELSIQEKFASNCVEINQVTEKKVIKKVIPIQNANLFSGLVVDLLTPNDDIEVKYADLIKQKKDVLQSVLQEICIMLNEQFLEELGELPEESGVWVANADAQSSAGVDEKLDLYDLIAVKYKGKLYTKDDLKEFISENKNDTQHKASRSEVKQSAKSFADWQ